MALDNMLSAGKALAPYDNGGLENQITGLLKGIQYFIDPKGSR